MVKLGCSICQSDINDPEAVLRTQCSHTYHKNCFNIWHQRNQSCPECRTSLDKQGRKTGSKSSGVTTRAQNSQLNTGRENQAQVNTPNPGPSSLNVSNTPDVSQIQQSTIEIGTGPSTSQNLQQEIRQADEERIRNAVVQTMQVQQAQLLEELENNISVRLEERIESTVTNLIRQMSIHGDQQARPDRENFWTREAPTNASPLNVSQFNRQLDNMRLPSSLSQSAESRHIAQLIQSWEIKFNGTSKLSVGSFIYRLETQVVDTLNGNFNHLCEHIQSLLTGEAKDWYWTYRKTVTRVTWPSFCEAIRLHFEEHKTDTEVKEAIRSRKQGFNETFDEYRNAIYKMTDKLEIPLAEMELVEIMQRGLRSQIRKQLLYVNINSVNQLRKYCLKGESLLNEISKVTSTNSRLPINRTVQARGVNEVAIEDDLLGEENNVDIEELRLVCWNCKQAGHKSFDCMEKRTVFCYGCGASNVYKPNCTKCSTGNMKTSEAFQRKSC